MFGRFAFSAMTTENSGRLHGQGLTLPGRDSFAVAQLHAGLETSEAHHAL
jgi:hypothetical protein